LSDARFSNDALPSKIVLVVDPDDAFGPVLQPLLGEQFVLQQQTSVAEAITAFDAVDVNAILFNLDAAGQNEISLLLRSATDREFPLPVIAYSWQAGGQKLLNAFKNGAFDTLSQPLDVQQLRFASERAVRRAQLAREVVETRRLFGTSRVEGLLGNSKPI